MLNDQFIYNLQRKDQKVASLHKNLKDSLPHSAKSPSYCQLSEANGPPRLSYVNATQQCSISIFDFYILENGLPSNLMEYSRRLS